MQMKDMTSYTIRIIRRMMEEDRRFSTFELFQKERIKRGALLKIMDVLKSEGIVEASRGNHGNGGFILTSKGKNISVYEIIRMMEGDLMVYPEIEQELYQDRHSSLYEQMKRANDEYIRTLKDMKVACCG